MKQKVIHGAEPWGWEKVLRSELVALICMSPHNCDAPGCPGPENKRKLEAFDDLLAALQDLMVYFKPVDRAIIRVDPISIAKAWAAIAKATREG